MDSLDRTKYFAAWQSERRKKRSGSARGYAGPPGARRTAQPDPSRLETRSFTRGQGQKNINGDKSLARHGIRSLGRSSLFWLRSQRARTVMTHCLMLSTRLRTPLGKTRVLSLSLGSPKVTQQMGGTVKFTLGMSPSEHRFSRWAKVF